MLLCNRLSISNTMMDLANLINEHLRALALTIINSQIKEQNPSQYDGRVKYTNCNKTDIRRSNKLLKFARRKQLQKKNIPAKHHI